MEGLVSLCKVRAYDHLEVASCVFWELNMEDQKARSIHVCSIDDCGKVNLVRVLYFVKIFTTECVELMNWAIKILWERFAVIGSRVHGQRSEFFE